MKEKLVVNIAVVVLLLIVALGIGYRLTYYLGFSLPWLVILALSAVGAAILLFWMGRSR